METVNRILQEKITARIAPNKAVLIFGARRVGKTVMMRKIVDNYSGRTMMLNGEDYDTLALLENRSIANYRHLLDGIDLLAIDEAQNTTVQRNFPIRSTDHHRSHSEDVWA